MSNAGSALMGIGRASGENRAVQAAQQAIDSPLLEVSIDGARGVLFNVIGGNDLSMHEINTAAETITSAADPDANIIFGATIDDKLEGEIIITVVATGFDASYFTERVNSPTESRDATPVTSSKAEDKDMRSLDVSLEDHDGATEDFTSDKAMPPNIWTLDDHQSSNDDGLLQQHDNDRSDSDEDHDRQALSPVSEEADDELEKPSFLRRLTKRHKEEDKDKPDQFRDK
jgi:cell division protein FtsZ